MAAQPRVAKRMPPKTNALYQARMDYALAELDRRSLALFRNAEIPAPMRGMRETPDRSWVRQLAPGSPRPPGWAGYISGQEWFWARWCARQCLHLWDAPAIVREYLETEDPALAVAEEDPHGGTPRMSASGAAALYCFIGPKKCQPLPASYAASSAMYAASGHIIGAANDAIEALAWAARAEVQRETPEASIEALQAAFTAAKFKVQEHFARVAMEIFEGEKHA